MKNFLILFLLTINYVIYGQFQDVSYQTGSGLQGNWNVQSELQATGQLIVYGAYSGTATDLFRLNTGGTQDLNFSSNIGTGFSTSPRYMKVQSDGKIIVLFQGFGNLITFNGVPIQNVIRLNADGTYDNSFSFFMAGNSGGWYQALIQNDGKIILANEDTILRINSNGTLDTTFSRGYTSGFTPNHPRGIFDIKLDINGKIIVGGAFSLADSSNKCNFFLIC